MKETCYTNGAKTIMDSIQFDDITNNRNFNMNSDSEDERASYEDIINNSKAKKRSNNTLDRNESKNESDRLEIIENGIKKRRLQRKELNDFKCKLIIDTSALDYNNSEGTIFSPSGCHDTDVKKDINSYQNNAIQCFTSSQYSTIDNDTTPTSFDSNTLKFYHDAAKYCQSYYIYHLNDNCDDIQLKRPPTNACNRSNFANEHKEEYQHDVIESENYNGQHKNFLPSSIISLDQAISFYPKPRIVIEAEYPYLIVHTNAGYAHLTGLQTDQIIGYPLFDFLNFSAGNHMSLKHCVSMSEVGKNVDVQVVASTSDSSSELSSKTFIQCSLTAYPVMSRSSNTTKVGKGLGLSHYVLDVIKCQESCMIVDDSGILEDKVTDNDFSEQENKMNLSTPALPSSSLENYLEAAVFCQTYYRTHLHEESLESSSIPNNRIGASKFGGRINHDATQIQDRYDSACINFVPSSTISLCQALSFYPKPRFIIEATFPFLIVHANAGYSHLTSFGSDITIGQPLIEFMTLANGNQISLKQCVIMSELGNNVIVEILTNPKNGNNKTPTIKCSLTAYPVMSNSNNNQNKNEEDESPKGLLGVSHYVLDMITCQNSLPLSDNGEQFITEDKIQNIRIKPIAVTMG